MSCEQLLSSPQLLCLELGCGTPFTGVTLRFTPCDSRRGGYRVSLGMQPMIYVPHSLIENRFYLEKMRSDLGISFFHKRLH